MANQIREALGKSEAGLLNLSDLPVYQAAVFIGLTQKLQPPYSDERALELIAKHEAMISERERRGFDPYATARAIHQAEPESSERAMASVKHALRNARVSLDLEYNPSGERY